VTGGRLYAHSLEKIIPGFADEAPVERRVVRETISMMTAESCFNIDFHSQHFAADPKKASYTVLRAPFDAWLAGKAEEAGCDVVCPARVDDLLRADGKVTGVIAGEDELTADLVILADGVNSLLAQKAGLKKELSPHQVGVGCKEIIELPKNVINDRFCLEDGEGVARLMAGIPSQGMMGGSFLYTNKESICLGLIVGVGDVIKSPARMPDMLESFKSHPAIKPLIAGGKLVEYSAHLVPEGGIHMRPTLCADNLLVVGDAAGFCINLGFTVRGMDYAIASGEAAAQTAIEAKEKGDYSAATLDAYKYRLEQGIVLKDLATFAKAPAFIEHTTRLYKEYPEMVEKIFLKMFTMDGEPTKKMLGKMLPIVLDAGVFNMAKDGIKGVGAL
jgi:electron transfer flavoprotein-quinone oxidoreductase